MQDDLHLMPSRVFSLLHDGEIVAHAWKGDSLVLTVNILYLAELLDPSFCALTVELRGARALRFRTWPKAAEADPVEFTRRDDVDAIFAAEPDILDARWLVGEARTHVNLNQSEPALDYCGGELSFECDEIIPRDPNGMVRTIAELRAVAERYWRAFAE